MTTYDVRTVPGEGTIADAHAVRRAVFIEGQGVSEAEEMDGRDAEAFHVVVYDREDGHPVGTTRLREADGHAKVERVAVRESYRGEGLGRKLMAVVEARARRDGHDRVVLHAQTDVEGFYADLSYETVSDVFYEADIPHVEMVKEL
ncbi:GNAT family N-acetyltransferase [Salinirussus salinus]|uniref:GNAT family N-acetyltransferase n=1 Tax=Salinirussus salinus TaxID=1198300 RepID=UPI00135A5A08|nr:GNAT family N-acetyltransferase [Salinirussus salinus]